jgi:threonine/homoserine/homoserine lactone efflux protein
MSLIDIAFSLGFGNALGLSIAAPPGPVNATIARDTVNKSQPAGMLVGLGAMTADAIFLVLTLALGSLVVLSGTLQGTIFLLGAGILFVMSFLTIRSFRKREDVLKEEATATTKWSYVAGLVIGITNPYQIFWWLTVGLSLINEFGPLVIVGFFIGIGFWITLFPYILDLGMKKFSKLYAAVMIFSIACLLVFAVWFVIQGSVLLVG